MLTRSPESELVSLLMKQFGDHSTLGDGEAQCSLQAEACVRDDLADLCHSNHGCIEINADKGW